MRAMLALAALSLLAACYTMKEVDLTSQKLTADQVVTLECHGACGSIRNLSTNQTRDLKSQDLVFWNLHVGTVLLEPGQYELELITHGAMQLWERTTYGVISPLVFIGSHRYEVEYEERVYSIRDMGTGQVIGELVF